MIVFPPKPEDYDTWKGNRCGWCGLPLPDEYGSCEEFTGEMCGVQQDHYSQLVCDQERAAAEW